MWSLKNDDELLWIVKLLLSWIITSHYLRYSSSRNLYIIFSSKVIVVRNFYMMVTKTFYIHHIFYSKLFIIASDDFKIINLFIFFYKSTINILRYVEKNIVGQKNCFFKKIFGVFVKIVIKWKYRISFRWKKEWKSLSIYIYELDYGGVIWYMVQIMSLFWKVNDFVFILLLLLLMESRKLWSPLIQLLFP